MKVAIFGGGTFGTAIASVIARNGTDVMLHVRDASQRDSINCSRMNSKYLPGIILPDRCKATMDLHDLADVGVIFLAVPTGVILKTCREIFPYLSKGVIVVNLAKGLHATSLTMDVAMAEVLPQIAIGSLKGPTFARPLLHGAKSGMTLALENRNKANEVKQIFNGSLITVELWASVTEVEFISAIKNVLAIVMGICDGIEENPNTRFKIIHDLINEAHSLLELFGFDSRVLFTYAGIGDLLLTSLNDQSRNRTLGLLIGRGFDFSSISNGPVLEGRRTVLLVVDYLEKMNVSHPLLSGLNDVFNKNLEPQDFYERIR
jgi:glycerol-3-phosphate dehydrogenase (NAD(P)+)